MLVLMSTYDSRGGVEPPAGLAGAVDGATVAATLLLDAVNRERSPVSA
jgi:hypothetical protein